MNDTVEDLILKLDNLPAFVQNSGNSGIEENSEEIIDLNKSQMLVLGVDSEGDQLGEYAPLSKKLRAEKGLQTDYIDLRFTGKFQDEIIVPKVDKGFEITSLDPKWSGNALARPLNKQWPDALGLTDENEDRLSSILTKKIDKDVDAYLSTSTPATKVLAHV